MSPQNLGYGGGENSIINPFLHRAACSAQRGHPPRGLYGATGIFTVGFGQEAMLPCNYSLCSFLVKRQKCRCAPARRAGVGCSVGVPPAVAWASCPRPRGSGTLPRQRAGRPRYKVLAQALWGGPYLPLLCRAPEAWRTEAPGLCVTIKVWRRLGWERNTPCCG